MGYDPVAGKCFPKAARIRKRADYRAMSRGARRFHTPHFVVLYRPAGGPFCRAGITVSRRVGNAVVRNRLKRYIREYFRCHARSLDRPWDIIFIAKTGAGSRTHAEVDAELASFWPYVNRRSEGR